MHEFLMKHGVFSWNELMTSDLEGAKDFYGKLFGWTYDQTEMESGCTYAVAKLGDAMVGGLFVKPPTVPENVPPSWGAYVTVDNVNNMAERVKELGGTIIFPLTDIPEVGRFCVTMDPQGAVISLISYLPDLKCCKE